jgi:hypothetical protein
VRLSVAPRRSSTLALAFLKICEICEICGKRPPQIAQIAQRGHGPQPKQGNRQDTKSAKTANSTRQAGTAPVKDRVADVGRQGICAAREEIEPL